MCSLREQNERKSKRGNHAGEVLVRKRCAVRLHHGGGNAIGHGKAGAQRHAAAQAQQRCACMGIACADGIHHMGCGRAGDGVQLAIFQAAHAECTHGGDDGIVRFCVQGAQRIIQISTAGESLGFAFIDMQQMGKAVNDIREKTKSKRIY